MALIFDLGLGCSGGGGSANITSLDVTPTTSAQTITASGGVDGYSPVNVSAVTSSIDANIVAGNIKKDVQILGVTGSYEGSTGGKYQLLERVKDDNNNEIGTVVGFFTGSHTGTAPYTEYAVVCLDAQYRSKDGLVNNYTSAIPNLPIYSGPITTNNGWAAKETATFNTQRFIDAIPFNTPACQACRSKQFTIDGVTYYGQLMNWVELSDFCKIGSVLDDLDITAQEYSDYKFSSISSTYFIYSSTATASSQVAAVAASYGTLRGSNRTTTATTFPILEIPNQ